GTGFLRPYEATPWVTAPQPPGPVGCAGSGAGEEAQPSVKTSAIERRVLMVRTVFCHEAVRRRNRAVSVRGASGRGPTFSDGRGGPSGAAPRRSRGAGRNSGRR